MDIFNAIRSIIFLVAGLSLILFPNSFFKIQTYLIEKLRLEGKINVERERKYYPHLAIVCFIISVILFAFAIAY